MRRVLNQIDQFLDLSNACLIKLAGESRIELARKKYPNMKREIDTLSSIDPSGGANKYLLWALKQYAGGGSFFDIAKAIPIFHENIKRFKKKDINKYDLAELMDDG